MATPVPLIDLQAQYARLKPAVDARVATVMGHARYVLGPEVAELEAALAARAGVAHAIGVASGTDALSLPLMAAGIGPGDAVFVPAFTFVATAGAVLAAGAVPVFCDVEPDTFALDPGDLARQLDTLAPDLRPRAVMAVDLFGQPADYGRIGALAAAHGLTVIADAAQSFGAALGNRPVGSLAPVTGTSFYPTKPLGGFGDGGMIFTADDALAARLRLIRVHGQGAGGLAEVPGLNSRLDTLQAAVLLARLETFDADLDRRRAIARRYDAAFAGRFGLQRLPEGSSSTVAVYAILCDGQAQRDRVRAALTGGGIGTRIYYEAPVHLMPAMRRFGAGPGSLPVSEELCTRILSLPVYVEMSDDQVDRVAATVIAAA